MSFMDVVEGKTNYHIEAADCIEFMSRLPDDSVDIVIGSPPYEDSRSLPGSTFHLQGEEWVRWMFGVFAECRRICTGLVAFVIEGRTQDFQYTATPILLMADLHRHGFNLRKPLIYRRIGIPGSGGSEWLKNNYEFIVCSTRPGKLPWADPLACAGPPKYAPGGPMSHRKTDGNRVDKKKAYKPPKKANPGNVIQKLYTAEEVDALLSRYECNDIIDCKVGGGHMGSKLAHKNEAPFPIKISDFLVKSFCRPGGIVLDCFLGSGTTAVSALNNGRRFLGVDLRQNQVDLAQRRIAEECFKENVA